MPELPEVENVRLGLKSFLPKEPIKQVKTNRKDLRFLIPTDELKKLKNYKILDIERRGKFLILKTEKQNFISHLGMTGTWRFESDYKKQKHDHVIFCWENTNLIYNDPRRFGYILKESSNTFKKFGPDPITDKIDINALLLKGKNSKTNIKTWLMNQDNILGIGNIYASEILFESKINPLKITSSLSLSNWKTIISKTESVLKKAIKNGGSSMRNYKNVNGQSGKMQNLWKTYNKEDLNCTVCKTKIKKIIIATRSTYYCPNCQKL